MLGSKMYPKFAMVLSPLLLIMACVSYSPERALQEFYSNLGPEETLMDPLILAGDKVVPLILERVKDKGMPSRSYAISFLGNGSYTQALPLLEGIFKDETETDDLRATALLAIFRIDQSVGLEYAKAYQNAQNQLGNISRHIIAGSDFIYHRRSYRDALSYRFR